MDEKQIQSIYPRQGVDAIKFGMSPLEVEAIWGPPDSSGKNFLGEVNESRSGIETTYAGVPPVLVEVGLPRRCVNAELNGVAIFQPNKLDKLKALLAQDPDVFEDVGMIVFKNLGVTLSGFLHTDDSDVAASVFAPGRWDEDLQEMNRFSL